MTNRAVRERLLASTIIAGAIIAAAPAFAQAAPAAPAAEAAEPAGEIVVTGSLIRNPNLISSAPVAVIGAEEVRLRQANTAESIIRDLPGTVPNIGSAVNNGNGGAAYVDLRGLGSNRNLVLLDGNRLVPTDLTGRVDLNNIPLALIERTDTLTGGAAVTYGADAVAGVVNFITRKDFSGAEVSVSHQITEQGDGAYTRADVTLGANFDDGRGNAVFSVGYQQADPVYQGDRRYSFYNIAGSNAAPAAAGSGTAVPSSFTLTGATPATQQINPATGALQAPFAPFNFNPYNIFQTPFKRYNMYGAAHYDVSDTVQLYTTGIFSKNTVKTILAPGGSFGETVTINVSNPYLPAAARAQFCASQDFDPNTPGVQTLTPAQCTLAAATTNPNDPNFKTFNTNVSRRTTELGPRLTTYTTQFFDYRAGIKVNITDKISLDVAGSHGESERNQVVTGNLRTSRLRQAALAVNTTTCLSGVSGAAAPESGCVPVDLFGAEGAISPSQASFLTTQTSVVVKDRLDQARALVSGDVGYTIPWADQPISFAIGAEYRKLTARQSSDVISKIPGEISGSGGAAPDIYGGYDVKEIYGEIVAPLVADKPFFHSLTAEGGIRYSKYKVFAPSNPSYKTTTYKAGGTWEPVEGVKFRGNYQRAVRAPNVNELFSPQQVQLTSLANDPCASVKADGTALNAKPTGNLLAVCLAQGANAGNVNSIAPPTAGQAESTQGGNLNLKPEKADSYTGGIVLQPRMLVPGLTFTADYYHIKIKGAIGTPTPGDAISACFGGTTFATVNVTAASATSAACTSIRRNPVTGGLDGSPATTPGVFLALSNLGVLKTDGIDFSANYRRDLGFARMNFSVLGNYTMSSKFKATPTAVNRECTGYYSTNCASIQPKFYTNTRLTLTWWDMLDTSIRWRRINKEKYEPLAGTIFSGVVPTQQGGAANPFSGQTVNFNRIPSFNYFDLTTRVSLGDHWDLTMTIDNLFDKKPPIVGASIGATAYNSGNTYPSTYDPLGRRYAVTARAKF
jgi:outer membrane receptor protein involved in Fe transport